jgi:hypothetical protein
VAADAIRLRSWPVTAVAAIALINVFDCLFTLAFLHLGLCQEANPLMRALYLASPWLFAAVKLAVVNLALAFLLKVRRKPFARAALLSAGVAYVALAAYELHQLVQHLAGA